MTIKRCSWVKDSNPIYVAYHDQEWGKPLCSDQKLFELLCLESYQSGLSWETVLNKRAAFNQVFYDYDVDEVARMSDSELDKLLDNPKLIRHKAKLYATRANAKAFIKVQKEFGSFNNYLWSWVSFTSIVNHVISYKELPTRTELSDKLSKDLKKRGFKFVGPICTYSYLQAAGLVNDHEDACEFK